MKQIFLDTETTGLVPTSDRVVEIAAIAYYEQQRIPPDDGGEYHQYINPQCHMPEEARKIHGLDDDFLAEQPLFADIADDFIEFVRDSEVIIHNANFDKNILNAELRRLGKPAMEKFTRGITCSLVWARENLPRIGNYGLDTLCREYGISLSERKKHSAIVDTRLLATLYYRMRQQQGDLEMRESRITVQVSDAEVIMRHATADELAAHNNLLADMEKELGAPPLYNKPG